MVKFTKEITFSSVCILTRRREVHEHILVVSCLVGGGWMEGDSTKSVPDDLWLKY